MREKGKTTCQKYGHLWCDTTSTNWRICNRHNCCKVERLVDGKWEDLSPVKVSLVVENKVVAESWINE